MESMVIEGKYKNSIITIAASDSTEELKKCADIVCDGEYDEITIQKVIDQCAKEKKDIFNGLAFKAFYNKVISLTEKALVN